MGGPGKMTRGLLLGLLLGACTKHNPAYVGSAPDAEAAAPDAGTPTADAALAAADAALAQADAALAQADAPISMDLGAPMDGGPLDAPATARDAAPAPDTA